MTDQITIYNDLKQEIKKLEVDFNYQCCDQAEQKVSIDILRDELDTLQQEIKTLINEVIEIKAKLGNETFMANESVKQFIHKFKI